MTARLVTDGQTERVRAIYDREAARYDAVSGATEWLLRGGRRWVAERVRGSVLEVAVGTGASLPWYSDGVRVVGVDLSRAMLLRATARHDGVSARVTLLQGDAQRLPFADGAFDTAVCMAALCTVPDHRRALAEMVRVLRPGGRLLLLEHVASGIAPVRLAEALLEPLTARRFGDHLLRDPEPVVRSLGLRVVERERHRLGVVLRLHAVRDG